MPDLVTNLSKLKCKFAALSVYRAREFLALYETLCGKHAVADISKMGEGKNKYFTVDGFTICGFDSFESYCNNSEGFQELSFEEVMQNLHAINHKGTPMNKLINAGDTILRFVHKNKLCSDLPCDGAWVEAKYSHVDKDKKCFVMVGGAESDYIMPTQNYTNIVDLYGDSMRPSNAPFYYRVSADGRVINTVVITAFDDLRGIDDVMEMDCIFSTITSEIGSDLINKCKARGIPIKYETEDIDYPRFFEMRKGKLIVLPNDVYHMMRHMETDNLCEVPASVILENISALPEKSSHFDGSEINILPGEPVMCKIGGQWVHCVFSHYDEAKHRFILANGVGVKNMAKKYDIAYIGRAEDPEEGIWELNDIKPGELPIVGNKA